MGREMILPRIPATSSLAKRIFVNIKARERDRSLQSILLGPERFGEITRNLKAALRGGIHKECSARYFCYIWLGYRFHDARR